MGCSAGLSGKVTMASCCLPSSKAFEKSLMFLSERLSPRLSSVVWGFSLPSSGRLVTSEMLYLATEPRIGVKLFSVA